MHLHLHLLHSQIYVKIQFGLVDVIYTMAPELHAYYAFQQPMIMHKSVIQRARPHKIIHSFKFHKGLYHYVIKFCIRYLCWFFRIFTSIMYQIIGIGFHDFVSCRANKIISKRIPATVYLVHEIIWRCNLNISHYIATANPSHFYKPVKWNEEYRVAM